MRSILTLAAFAVLALPGLASADKLSDFNAAAGKTGCAAIPYSSMSGSCRGLSGKVNNNCKTGKMSCSNLGTKGLRKNIEDLKRAVSSLKSKGKRDEADAKQKLVDQQKRQLDQQIRDIEQRIRQGNQCVGARKAVRTLFKNAKSKVKGEGDQALRSARDRIVRTFEGAERGHDDAIDNYTEMVNICKSSKSGSR